MLSLVYRTVVVFLRALWGARIELFGESSLRFRVMPGDLDINVHMNNGRYLALMDLGRLDLMVRGGLLPVARERRWRPLLGSASIRFRRSLEPFQAFELRTRLLCWDDRWFVFEQRFESRGQLCAVAIARGLFRGPEGTVSPAETLRAGGLERSSPPFPDYVTAWAGADDGAWSAAAARAPDQR